MLWAVLELIPLWRIKSPMCTSLSFENYWGTIGDPMGPLTVSFRSTLVDITSANYILIDQHQDFDQSKSQDVDMLFDQHLEILIDQNLDVDQSKYN